MKQQKARPTGDVWREKNIRDFSGSPAARIGDEWMLITCGGAENWNTMTASWGGIGVLWGKDVAFMFIRPTRFTYPLANESELFTLSFFDASYRRALEVCGAKSGRDTDKAAAAGLTPIVFPDLGVSFQEADEVILCRKLYVHDFDPRGFLDSSLESLYPIKDYHRMFIGEILSFRSKKPSA
ncbi:MAG: flavin reductase family protein [Spirochaetaceae bacterium]|jgi:flavin reductase (DIM6/NTAB) family NADH-FMN oxidoreductase RutF|nr:flavin reductase family protein [Spirochaetaceae bacterium]